MSNDIIEEMSNLKSQISKVSNEETIVREILRGKEKALRQFYHLNAPKLTNFIRQRVSNEKDVEELVQDTLLATIEGLRDFRFQSSLFTFMCGIGKRKVIDYYRRKKIKRIVFSRIPAIEPLLAILTTPEDTLDEKLLEQKISRTFTKLSTEYQTILKLKYIHEWSVDKIALELNMSFKSVESMLFRARKKFVQVYGDTNIRIHTNDANIY